MALGILFGLMTSLMLKHSYLHLYPAIESCLVALCAYTCYFFSNGISMSGIVSLLFCGITLKHYAYHTMSRRTQRATKYIFSTLARLSENFIFIYLGLSLFTGAPVSEPVFSYVKPVFIVISLISVIFTRYAAVFPLSQLINFVLKHGRGQRQEEIPHPYQMMLFWAGLRGAVGVALAAGFKGPNAQMMRTTVLIVVVLTVLLFGGTTARMLEVLGIRTGVEDDVAVSSDEEEPMPPPGRNAWVGRNGTGPRWGRIAEEEGERPRGAARIGAHYANTGRFYNHHQLNAGASVPAGPTNLFSAASSDSYDSDGEVLPLAPTASGDGPQPSSGPGHTSSNSLDEGKWFQAIDERYLLPIFSNATASRTFHARRAAAARRSSMGLSSLSRDPTPGESEDEMDLNGYNPDVESGPTNSRGAARSIPAINTVTNAAREESRSERGLSSPVIRNTPSNLGESRFS